MKSKTLYWGFPVCIISSIDENKNTNITPISSIYNVNDIVMIGINTSSNAYKNIKTNKNIIINVITDTM
ncbi:pyridoxamine 5'-phosphate oxidase family protein [Spiroplasma tabanidicola]|uniref:pyridoxamine 5'-phosphate oxidase family protein n=1 Tax=Spiroplasma tabanidicola TaxID=324079 RepID=UPI0012DC37F0